MHFGGETVANSLVPLGILNSLVKSLPHRTRGGASFLTDEGWLRSGDSGMRSGAGHYLNGYVVFASCAPRNARIT